MILAGLKKKSNQIFFKKKTALFLGNNTPNIPTAINSVIVFLDDISDKKMVKKSLLTLVGNANTSFEFVVFQDKTTKKAKETGVFTSQDFGWFGNIHSQILKHILLKKYDLLVNYQKEDNVYTNLLLLQCKALFAVGYAHLNKNFYNLLIDCKAKDKGLFDQELKKYLDILNKK